MKFYITGRSIRYKGKTYLKGACIEADTEQEKAILRDLVNQGYASENAVNIGVASKIIDREREDLNEKSEELKEIKKSLDLKEKELFEKEKQLNNIEHSLNERIRELDAKEEKLKTSPGNSSGQPNEEQSEGDLNSSEVKMNDKIYQKLTKKEKGIYDALSEEDKNTVSMLESYEDVKAYLHSVEEK